MSICYIVGAGEFYGKIEPKSSDLVIAADGGADTLKRLGVRCDLLLGDMDSLREKANEKSFPTGCNTPSSKMDDATEVQSEERAPEAIVYPVEKDETDTQLAVEIAIDRGADEIIVIGGLTGRLDHTLSTLAILEDIHARGLHGYITDGQSRAHYMKSSSTLIARSAYKYLSLIAADEVVKGVDVEGCKYPLKKATLTRRNQFAVSNEITGNVAFIAVKKGGIYIIESKDL